MALPANTVAYWHLNEANGNAADTGPNGHTLTNNDTVTYQAGKLNNGAGTFTATRWLSGADSADWDFGTGAFAIAFWIKKNGGAFQGFMGDDDAWLGAGTWGIYTGAAGTITFTDAATNIISVANVCDDVWNRVVITRDGTGANQARIYVNNSLDKTGTLDQNFNGGEAVHVGRAPGLTAFGGYLDDVIIIKGSSWGATEVSTDWNGGAGIEYTSGPDFTKMQINIGDAWKLGAGMQVNIGDAWKSAAGMQVNIGDAWKTVF